VFRVFGMSAITAVTVQNTCEVRDVHPVPAPLVRQQIDAVATDIGIDAVKTGMLVNAAIISAVASAVRDHHLHPLVIDPVMLAGTGAALLDADAREALVRELLPNASLITPNVPEAEALAGVCIRTVADMRVAARRLIERGAGACLVKGGHLTGAEVVDVFDDGTDVREFTAPRLAARHTHGTGCQLSAAIAANLARGLSLPAAIDVSKRFITAAIRGALALGHGTGPANPLVWLDEK
jgi:hydroxymethylpyrimidine/phosphomethylpyrimidine kinase